MGTPRPEIAAIIARYCVLLEELGIHVEQAILYSSHARGEARDPTHCLANPGHQYPRDATESQRRRLG